MAEEKHLTDQQVQEYFESNASIIEYSEHLNQCNACRIRLANYNTLADALKKNRVIPPLQIDLATAVSEKVFARKSSFRFPVDAFLYGVAFVVLAIMFGFAFKSFQRVHLLEIILLTLPIVLFISLSIKESMVLIRRLKQSSYS